MDRREATHASVSPEGDRITPGGGDAFSSALAAASPAATISDDSNLYGWLIGSWEVEVVDHLAGGARRENRGEWHFSWVLEGRAMQDVWIVPARPGRDVDAIPGPGNRYGTSIRVYDPRTGEWRVTWINPVNLAENRLIGRRHGARIVQEGAYPDGARIRWTFSDIATDSFTWTGERSTDGGTTWQLETEFVGRRVRRNP